MGDWIKKLKKTSTFSVSVDNYIEHRGDTIIEVFVDYNRQYGRINPMISSRKEGGFHFNSCESGNKETTFETWRDIAKAILSATDLIEQELEKIDEDQIIKS